MSFWTGKKESLVQSLVEITFKALLSGLVIVFFAQFLIAMVDNRIEVASKRDALNTFRNDQLTMLTTRFTKAYMSTDCARSLRSVDVDTCQSEFSALLTELNSIYLELRIHYPDQDFDNLLSLETLTNTMRAQPEDIDQAALDVFASTFGASLDEIAQNFR